MFDDSFLVGIATADPTVKMTDDLFLPLPYGIGIQPGNLAMKRWVDSRLDIMRNRDAFYPIMKANVPARLLPASRRTSCARSSRSSTTRSRPDVDVPVARRP